MTIEKRKEEPLLNLLKREFGEWPILNSKWNESKSKFDWVNDLLRFRIFKKKKIYYLIYFNRKQLSLIKCSFLIYCHYYVD